MEIDALPRATGRILLVEDDRELRGEVRELLEDDGHQVVELGDGAQALRWLQNGGDCSLIILDLNMPVMNGGQFLAELRHHPSLCEIPILILSVHPVGRAVGRPAFQKPIGNKEAFLRAVRDQVA
jgi:CheY-like chemotaxis protein